MPGTGCHEGDLVTNRYRVHFAKGVAAVLAAGLLAAACGGSSTPKGTATTKAPTDAGKPQLGGEITYALEGESDDGWCLPSAQLAISGIQVARTIYDQLAAPDEAGNFVPFLAKTITPNAKFDKWTITLRDGIKFHDGTALDATVVKNNLMAYRGAYANRGNVRLFAFTFLNIKDVAVTDPMTVTVTTAAPWVQFPAFLYGSGRVGIMAQAQLDSKDHCGDEMIGTGPFQYKGGWVKGDKLPLVKNPNYWRKDADGVQLPYLDAITYKVVTETDTTVAGLGTQYTVTNLDSAEGIDRLRKIAKTGKLNLLESQKYPEVSYTMLNNSKLPFSNINARFAYAHAINFDESNILRNKGINERATGPFGPGVLGNLPDQKLPEFSVAKAKDYVAKYEKETGEKLHFVLSLTPDQGSVETAKLAKKYLEDAGMKVDNLKTSLQAALIDNVIAGDFQAAGWRNHPGFDPDTQYVWWSSAPNPVNFGRWNDPEMDKLLDLGRSSSDPAVRKQAYEDINKRFNEKQYSVWSFYTLWVLAADPKLQGLLGPNLPTADSPDASGAKPFPGLAVGNDVSGLWLKK